MKKYFLYSYLTYSNVLLLLMVKKITENIFQLEIKKTDIDFTRLKSIKPLIPNL